MSGQECRHVIKYHVLLLQFLNPKNQSASLTYAGIWQNHTNGNREFITLIPEFTSEINTQYSPGQYSNERKTNKRTKTQGYWKENIKK